MPLDSITRGLSSYDTTQASETGTALVIETSVPILIENLKITGGNANYQNGSPINNYDKGGGLQVNSGAVVSLGNGTVIIENRAKYGGGVYNEGTLCLFGSAVVGNPSASSVASGYDSSDVSANYGSSYGGGIYNTATGQVYISSGNIKYNADDGSSSGGGGLMNCGIASMSGGTIYKNAAKSGGGVYLTAN